MSEVVVAFGKVSKRFKEVEALRDVSFDVMEGEILGFVGPNGCGKTTTVRLMSGFYKPTKGRVRVFGSDPARELSQIGSRLGVMLEQPGIHGYLTGREYLEYYGGIFRMPSSVIGKRCPELLRLVGLSDRADSLLRTFSKGMRQRISMARCMLNRPKLMVLDEPFDGLDVESRRVVLDLLPRVSKEEATSVFITSHNLAEIEEVSDRIAIIKQGRVIAIDKMESLRNRVINRKVVVVNLAKDYPEEEVARLFPEADYRRRERNLVFTMDGVAESHNELLRRILDAGMAVYSVSAESDSLEDIYFALTKETRSSEV
jgi:ABC-2 type transport system ATP-binding protein